jgi:hypothetical protein
MLPNDPAMLLSYINTKLRDEYASLDELCASMDIDEARLREKLETINYFYDDMTNQFC